MPAEWSMLCLCRRPSAQVLRCGNNANRSRASPALCRRHRSSTKRRRHACRYGTLIRPNAKGEQLYSQNPEVCDRPSRGRVYAYPQEHHRDGFQKECRTVVELQGCSLPVFIYFHLRIDQLNSFSCIHTQLTYLSQRHLKCSASHKFWYATLTFSNQFCRM